MPFNGAGSFTPYTPGNPVVAGTTITAATHNQTISDLAAGLTNAMTRDGQSPATADIPMGGFKLTGLAAAIVAGHAVRYEQVGALALAQGAQAAGSYAGAGANSDITSMTALTSINGDQIGTYNYLINGAFDLWQRSTSVANPAGYAATDRWTMNASNMTVSRVAAAAGDNCTFKMRMATTSASNSGLARQALEAAQVDKLKGKTVTFSVYMQATTNCSVTLLIQKSATADSSSAGFSTIVTQVMAVTTTRTRFSVTVAVPDDGTANGLLVGINFTNIGNANNLDCMRAQLEIGSIPTAFAHRSLAEETALCHRYYYHRTPTTGQVIGIGQYGWSNTFFIYCNFPVPMRTLNYTVSTSSTASDFTVGFGAGSTLFCNAVPSLSSPASLTCAVLIMTVASGAPATSTFSFGFMGASSYVGFSAELT